MTTITDNFNRSDSTDLGTGWVEVSGDWSIVSQQLSPGSAGGTIILRAATAMATADHSVQVKIAATTAASQGVWGRGNSNITSGYLLRNNGTSWDLFSVVGGSFTVIGTYTAAAAAGDIAKLQVVGTSIKAYINDVLRISVTDSAVTTGTSVGLRGESTGALRYDDFAAADVTAGATLDIASSTETAQPLTGAKAAAFTPATEADTPQTLSGLKSAPLGTSSSVESAQPLTDTKTTSLTPATEQDTAQNLSGAKTAALGTAGSVETAQPLAEALTAALPPASSTETAQPLTGAKTATLAPALEADTARLLTKQSTLTHSPERTYKIPAERRRLTVPAEHRTLTIRR